ncbi:MAG TPA: ADP-forming succinate--CoA ligase subunit beta, partial [Armatimonadota bacterium]|nr:ADP-forming succinate--CoA ligase subunit beta [Armatimonadota bacterium]
MKIHEYQAKQILAKFGVPVPAGEVCTTAEEVERFAASLARPVVVKAQVHVGGRGKAGGIKVAKDASEARQIAADMLGSKLKGLTVEKVLVEEALDIHREYYLGITIDRAAQKNAFMISSVGGVDIEQIADKTPEKISKLHVDPATGLLDFQIRQACFAANLDPAAIASTLRFARALYDAYIAIDGSLAEINPLVLTGDGSVIAADAKINIDDNALFRHPELAEWEEESEEDEIEAEAHRRHIQYVRLGGDIGIIGNGAGLVMTTIDEVNRAGGRAANFLDIGGGARAELVRNALEIVLMDPHVKGLLFNVFGGITRCDEVARGIIEATSTMDIKVPVVIRLAGTMEAEGKALLHGASLIAADTMQEAAATIVRMTR